VTETFSAGTEGLPVAAETSGAEAENKIVAENGVRAESGVRGGSKQLPYICNYKTLRNPHNWRVF